eukprot:3940651-Rhodomonas_salina.8
MAYESLRQERHTRCQYRVLHGRATAYALSVPLFARLCQYRIAHGRGTAYALSVPRIAWRSSSICYASAIEGLGPDVGLEILT